MTVGGRVAMVTSGGFPSPDGVFGAFARFNNGGGRYVEATWVSSDDSVIAIVGTTMVAHGRGTATLTATFEGKSDTETFIVDAGVAGRWAGSYVVEQCTASSGSMVEVLCGIPGRMPGRAAVGARLPLTMDIVANGDALTGTLALDQFRGTLTGVNGGAGFFYLLGRIDVAIGAINILSWDTRVVRDAMEGSIAYEVKLGSLPGYGTVAGKLEGVTRQ